MFGISNEGDYNVHCMWYEELTQNMNLHFHSRTFYFLSDHFQICQRSFPLYFYYHLFPLSPLPLCRFSSSVSASPVHRKGTIEEILNRLIPNRKNDEVKKLKAPYKSNSSSASLLLTHPFDCLPDEVSGCVSKDAC